jgi:uncharacterized protein YjiS (DUF1127 family)
MNSSTLVLTAPPSSGIAGALRRIVAGAHWLKIAYAERRRAARERAEFESLDASTLRDLGLSRDEYLSYAAEARGLVPCTRLRIRDDRARSSSA